MLPSPVPGCWEACRDTSPRSQGFVLSSEGHLVLVLDLSEPIQTRGICGKRGFYHLSFSWRHLERHSIGVFRWVRCALERPSGQQEQPEALDLAVFIEPFFFFNCIEIQLVYHIVLVSGVQKVIQLYIHTYIYILEKGMATHSSILAWRIPWTEEPGRLWSIG